jgi:hypothetical protein
MYILSFLKNRALRTVLVPKKMEVTEDCRNVRTKELHEL